MLNYMDCCHSRKRGSSIPRTPTLIRNRSPARDSRVARAWDSGARAEVTYNSSRVAPPNVQLVGYVPTAWCIGAARQKMKKWREMGTAAQSYFRF